MCCIKSYSSFAKIKIQTLVYEIRSARDHKTHSKFSGVLSSINRHFVIAQCSVLAHYSHWNQNYAEHESLKFINSWKYNYKRSPSNSPRSPRGGVEVQLYSFFNLGLRLEWVVNATSPAVLPSGKTRYPLYRRLGGPQGRSGRVRKISHPTGIRSPDHPACNESPYRLSYRGPRKYN